MVPELLQVHDLNCCSFWNCFLHNKPFSQTLLEILDTNREICQECLEMQAAFPKAVKNWNQVLDPMTILVVYANVFFNLKFRIWNPFMELASYAFHL